MSIASRDAAQGAAASTKDQIKLAAQTLFGRFGIDGVTVQQIVAAAGQRNNASLHYHFGNKDELVRQLVVDGAQRLDERRQRMLAEAGAAGGPATVRAVLEILVQPVVELGEDERWRGYIRFISNLQLSNREVLRKALDDQWNAAYVHCLGLLRRMLAGQPAPIVEQKLSFLGIYANAVLTAREAARERFREEPHRFWSGAYTYENILDTLEAMLVNEPSARTMERLAADGGTRQ